MFDTNQILCADLKSANHTLPDAPNILRKHILDERYKQADTNRWIKQLHRKPIANVAVFDDYAHRGLFMKVADILLDVETYQSGNKSGQKKRNTLIQCCPCIEQEAFQNKEKEWVYLFVLDGNIIKIGGTRVGLKGRFSSYLCGHHIQERQKSGKCSVTNAFVYNTFVFYLENGCRIEMYGYEIPHHELTINMFSEERTILAQTYHAYESIFLEDYRKQHGEYPPLSDNCDPKYKTNK